MTMTPAEAFGKVLKKIRNKSGLSQEQLALQSDLDRTFISLLERGKRQPSLTSILEVAERLNTPASELIRLTVELLNEDGMK